MISKVLIILAVFSLLIAFDISAAQNTDDAINFELKENELKKDSPFLDTTPRIDTEGAAVSKEDTGKENYQVLNHKAICRTLPQNMWVLVLAAYVFLIIFNLTYQIDPKQKTRWFWEALYTILALLAWYSFDECKFNTWFAQSVIILGVIIYFFYLYHFKKYQAESGTQPEAKENTAQLPLK